MSLARLACSPIIFAAALGCGADAVAPVVRDAGPSEYRVSVATQPSLVQIVRLDHTLFAQGGYLRVASVIRNEGTTEAAATTRICGLNVEGIESASMLACAGYSMSASIPPGDSLVGGDSRVIKSTAGHYTMRVQQLVDPALWVSIPIDVSK